MDFHGETEELQTQPRRRPERAAHVPDEVGEDAQRRMAAMTVRRMCNQHECTAPRTGACDHPNHRRDTDYLLSASASEYPGMLDILGLDHTYPMHIERDKATWLAWIEQSGPQEDQQAA